ncbi:MAG: hypothetical protein KC777_05000 [Cyanobacteria bacterium HKST-UBA02]|nr:hypothetical protein [Cyanobacteria bacterium HKST-UBA02]
MPSTIKLPGLLLAISLILGPPAFSQALEDDTDAAGLDTPLRSPILPGPEKELPTSPEEVSRKGPDPESDKSALEQTPLIKGSAQSEAIETSAELMEYSPLSRYKGDSLRFLKVRVKNTGRSPMLILGNKASLTPSVAAGLKGVSREDVLAGGQTEPSTSVSAEKLEEHDNTILTGKKKALVGAIGVGTLGLGGMLAYETMNPGEYRKRNLGVALGRDAGRHEVEAERLGTRLMMPGDDTEGWAAFPEAELNGSDKLYLPVMYPPYTRISGVLKISISGKADDTDGQKVR